MTDNTKLTVASKSEACISEFIFGPPPILKWEHAEAYAALLLRVTEAVKPEDILEQIWVRDVVNATWENLRWRRLVRDLVTEDVLYLSLSEIERIERVDRLAMTAEVRRNAALRELERHRLSFAQRLRSAVSEAEEAEFQIVEHKGVAPSVGNAA